MDHSHDRLPPLSQYPHSASQPQEFDRIRDPHQYLPQQHQQQPLPLHHHPQHHHQHHPQHPHAQHGSPYSHFKQEEQQQPALPPLPLHQQQFPYARGSPPSTRRVSQGWPSEYQDQQQQMMLPPVHHIMPLAGQPQQPMMHSPDQQQQQQQQHYIHSGQYPYADSPSMTSPTHAMSVNEPTHECMVGLPNYPSPRPLVSHKARFVAEDDGLLKHLKEDCLDPKLSWKQIADFFPGRASGTLQVRYCTKVKLRNEPPWTEEAKKRLLEIMDEIEDSFWIMCAERLRTGASAASCQEVGTALRTARVQETPVYQDEVDETGGPVGYDPPMDHKHGIRR